MPALKQAAADDYDPVYHIHGHDVSKVRLVALERGEILVQQ